jgi:hypothetical protein
LINISAYRIASTALGRPLSSGLTRAADVHARVALVTPEPASIGLLIWQKLAMMQSKLATMAVPITSGF